MLTFDDIVFVEGFYKDMRHFIGRLVKNGKVTHHDFLLIWNDVGVSRIYSEIRRLRSLSPNKRKYRPFVGAGGSAGGSAGEGAGGDGAGGVETVDSRPEWPGRATNYEVNKVRPRVAFLCAKLMNVAKRMMIHPQSGYEVSVTALFILDGLLKQELFVGIIGLKLFQHELPAVKRLERIAREQRRADVLDVLRALLLQGPVSFYYTHELGLSMPVDAAMNSPYKYAIMANDQLSALVEIHKLREEYSDIGGAAAHLEESFAQRLTACLKIVKPVKSAKRARLASDPQDKSGPSGSSAEPKAGGSKQPKKRKAMESQEQAQPVGLAQRDEPIPSGSGINKGKGKSSANSAPPGEGNASNKRKRISHFDCTCDSDGEDHECQSTSAGNAGDSYGDDLDLSLFTKEMPRAGPSGSSQAGGAAEAKSTGDSADTADSTDSDSTDDDEGIDFNAEDDEIPVIEVVPKADRLAMQGRKVERRYLKQTILKSRLRRMGILEVAFGIPEEE